VAADEWTHPDSLDAPAAAPESHRLLFENDAVRVLETEIAPGDATPLHTHRWPGCLYVLSFGHFVRRGDDGSVLVDSREGGDLPQPGTALWSGPLPPHTLENVGDVAIHVIGVELKSDGDSSGTISPQTVRRLRQHAGLEESESPLPTVSSCLPERGRIGQLGVALADLMATLGRLNHELNGAVPSEAVGDPGRVIPGSVAYAVAEVSRMLRRGGDTEREAHAVDTAWLAVLAGDVDDVLEHVAGEEAALAPSDAPV
jgi:hypothetical protein